MSSQPNIAEKTLAVKILTIIIEIAKVFFCEICLKRDFAILFLLPKFFAARVFCYTVAEYLIIPSDPHY